MADSRRRSLSLELDYGDDPDMDHAHAPAPTPTPSSSSALPAPVPGLPANPLTGVRPTAAHTNGNATASTSNNAGVTSTAANRLTAVYLGDLHWWTSDADIVHLCALAGLDVPFRDVVFSQHKVNGKSKGVVWVECGASDKAQQLKAYIDR
ncbi:hypothetical protein JCM3775_004276, partial [Rhodotorula graminis]